MPKTLTDDQVLALFEARWLTSAEAARVLGIVPGAVRKLFSDKRLERHKIGATLFVKRVDVEAYSRSKSKKGRKPSRE